MRLQPDRLLTRRVDPLVMKSLNAIELLELVRTAWACLPCGPRQPQPLSKPTVSDQVDALIAPDCVVEIGPGKTGSRGGKKPTLLQFNGDHGQILCADIGPDWIRFAAADLRGTILQRNVVPTRPEKGARAVVRVLKNGLKDLLAASPGGQIRVISLAAPGIIDVHRGNRA